MQRRNTKQRQIILEDVKSNVGHFTADEIYKRIHKLDTHISRGTVYRNLQILADDQQIRRIQMPNVSDRYEGILRNHDHLVCRGCGKIVDIESFDHRADQQEEQMSGFAEIRHSFLFSGICPECKRKLENK